MKNTRFIVLEGIDGSGKSTLAAGLEKKLNERGLKTARFNEPTGYPTGLRIREFLKNHEEISPQEQLDLFIADRHESVRRNILPAMAEGNVVILDRYYYSTAAYQSGRDYTAEEIIGINRKENFPEPDIIFYLDIEPDKSLARVNKRGEAEYFEKKETLEKIRNEYLRILKDKAVILDASLPPEELVEKAMKSLEGKL